MMAGSAGRPPVLGADGCRGGWAVVEWDREAGTASVAVVHDLGAGVARVRRGEVAALAIDMPIGLLDDRSRRCDVEARSRLGPRRSSVFPAPVRPVLGAVDYGDACRRSRAASGRALSRQSFNLVPSIAALDRLLDPADQDRIVEAHPELAFARLAGAPLDHAKRTALGRRRRIELLAEVAPPLAAAIDGRGRAPLLDVIDAAALAVTAGHVADGTEHRLGGETDPTGLVAAVVY